MTAGELLNAGRLTDAITAATEAVKLKPGDRPVRRLLAELLFVGGHLERADKQFAVLDTAEALDRATIWRWRQIVRAEAARREVFTEGRVPTLLAEPTDPIKLTLEAIIAIREGDTARAVSKLQDADAARPPVTATIAGVTGPLRDADDVCAGFVEAFGADGEYYWVPFELLTAIECRVPARPGELAVRPAKWSLRTGSVGEVILPATYWNSPVAGDEFALGRATDTPEGAIIRGVGQREWFVGETVVPFLSLARVEFSGA